MADITIHEWLHTIEGQMIQGRSVPYVDSPEAHRFGSTVGADGQATWHDWYRFMLGA
jgi:hypothetical protein